LVDRLDQPFRGAFLFFDVGPARVGRQSQSLLLGDLLGTQLLEGAWNLAALRDRFDEWADDEEDDGG
jgi:hypothetical protein